MHAGMVRVELTRCAGEGAKALSRLCQAPDIVYFATRRRQHAAVLGFSIDWLRVHRPLCRERDSQPRDKGIIDAKGQSQGGRTS